MTPTFTYNPLLASPLDRLRFALGDTDITAALLPDQTYLAVFGQVDNEDEQQAQLILARGLIAWAANQPTRVEVAGEGGTVSWGDRLVGWRAIVDRLAPRYDLPVGGGVGGVAMLLAGPTRARRGTGQ